MAGDHIVWPRASTRRSSWLKSAPRRQLMTLAIRPGNQAPRTLSRRGILIVYTRCSVETKVQKWGNSLGVRIPRALAADVRLRPGTSVRISAEDESIVIRPLDRPTVTLGDMLKRVTRANLHHEVDTGEPRGNERS
jgi:antitoxin MazE